jgi:hypothetical protein
MLNFKLGLKPDNFMACERNKINVNMEIKFTVSTRI